MPLVRRILIALLCLMPLPLAMTGCLQLTQWGLKVLSERHQREVAAFLEASVDRSKCGPEHWYYFRISGLLMRVPAIQVPGAFTPSWSLAHYQNEPGRAYFEAPGYDHVSRVLCGNTIEKAPRLVEFHIGLPSLAKLEDQGESEIVRSLRALSNTNVRSIRIAEPISVPHCVAPTRRYLSNYTPLTQRDGVAIMKLNEDAKKLHKHSDEYLVVISESQYIEPTFRSVGVHKKSTDWERDVAIFSNCYDLPVSVGGYLRSPTGELAEWQHQVDRLVAALLVDTTKLGPIAGPR